MVQTPTGGEMFSLVRKNSVAASRTPHRSEGAEVEKWFWVRIHYLNFAGSSLRRNLAVVSLNELLNLNYSKQMRGKKNVWVTLESL